MSTEMQPNQPSPTRKILTYKQLFSMPEPLEDLIMAAASRLGVATGKVLDPATLAIWAQNLEKFSPAELAQAFERAEAEVAAFPAVAHIVGYVRRERFMADYLTVLQGLRLVGVEWQSIPPRQGPGRWDYSGPERVFIEGIWYPAIAVPELPERMLEALAKFGGGKMHDGLRRLKRDHPMFWTDETEYQTGQHGRQASMIERDLYNFWLMGV